MVPIDLLCVGHACYDLVFSVDHHPGPDEKCQAETLISCGGGTAANAAVTAAKLGYRVAFAGYLGDDLYGEEHLHELQAMGVDTALIVRGSAQTPLSAIFVKPDGARSIVNYKGDTSHLTIDDVAVTRYAPSVVLFDGHQPALALSVAEWAAAQGITTVVDADSLNQGNLKLIEVCDHVVASERFASDVFGAKRPEEGMAQLAQRAPNVVVTLGARGLIWQRGDRRGQLNAFDVEVVDTTGAGDTFHGAYAAALAKGMEWDELLRYASAAGALCCTVQGARIGIPSPDAVAALMETSGGKA